MEPTSIQPDAKQLRALAHPVRVSLLALLRADGPGTASSLGLRLGLSSGLTSYHLRALAAAGFIDEDPERGTARERWWKAGHEFTVVDPSDSPADNSDVAAVFERRWDHWRHDVEGQWQIAQRGKEATPWSTVRDRSDWLFRLTPTESTEAMAAVTAALEPFVERSVERRDGDVPVPVDADFVMLFTSLVPVSDLDLLLRGMAGEVDEAEYPPDTNT